MEQYLPRIERVIRETPGKALNAIFATYGSTLYVPGFVHRIFNQKGNAEAALAYALADPKIVRVVITQVWTGYFCDRKTANTDQLVCYLEDDDGRKLQIYKDSEGEKKALQSLAYLIPNLIIDCTNNQLSTKS